MKMKAVYLTLALVLLFSLVATIVPAGTANAATLCVNPGGTGGCYPSIQAAVTAANPLGGDTIIVAAGQYNEHIIIDRSLTIEGAGAGSTIVDGSNNGRVFHINGAYTVEMSGMTIRNGNASIQVGGGIYNQGTLTITDCTISGNYANDGGGIFNASGNMTITNCTISGNSAWGEDSGGIYNSGTLTMTNCTVSDNDAVEDGGGIDNRLGGNVTLTNCTIADNHAEEDGGGIRNDSGTLTLTCTIVYGNTAGGSGDDIHNLATLILDYYSIIGGTDDPLLGPLQNNGGPTETHALLTGSPAIDSCLFGCTVTTDQRGLPRPVDGDLDGTYFCDVGAYEKQIAVGGTVEPVDRLELLAPWLALAALTAVAVSVVVAMRRRRLA